MSNINEKNKKEMSIKEIFNEIEDRNKLRGKARTWKVIKGILGFWPKMLGSMFGLDKESLTSVSKNAPRRGPGEFDNVPHPPQTPQTFREGYKKNFNPYDYDVASQLMYYKLVDGKGDPEPRDCHCDHDER